MGFQTVILAKQEGVATLALNRPERLNALNRQLVNELKTALQDVAEDEETRVLVLTGAGKAFCAGGDFQFSKIKAGAVDVTNAEDIGISEDMRQGRLLHRVMEGIILPLFRMGKPTIAMVNGAAIASGFDLALTCDIRTGSEKAKFGVGFTKLGLTVGTGGTWLLPRVIGVSKALEYIYSGDICAGEEAYRIGLLNKFVPSEQLESETMKLAISLAKGAPIAQRLAKMQVYKGLETDFEAALAFSSACEFITLSSEDHREGVMAFAQKRPPIFKGK